MRDGSGRVTTSTGSPRRSRRRRGASVVLALLYLVLFSSLALGFYAQTNLGAQVAANEDRVLEAQVASESGLQLLRHQLSRVNVAATVPREQVLEEVYNQLSALMDGTGNLGTGSVGYATTPTKAINIPSDPAQYVSLGPGGAHFRANITELPGNRLRIKTTGRCGGGAVARSIAMDFVEVPRRSPVLDYGVATRGTVEVNARAAVRGDTDSARGSLLSTYTAVSQPVDMKGGGNAVVSGRVYLTHPTGSVAGSGTISGVSDTSQWPTVVHANTAAPEFPAGGPSRFVEYLVGRETLITGSSSAAYLSNIRIKAGANPTFSGGGTYEGVLLVEAPNQVSFSSGSTIRGVIVCANPSEGTSTNKITFNGVITFYGTETLSDSFGSLKTMTGSSVVAPNFQVDLVAATGTVVSGATLVKNLSLSMNSVVTMSGPVVVAGTGKLYLSSDSVIRVAGSAPANIPAGFRFTHSYAPHPATYLEVQN